MSTNNKNILTRFSLPLFLCLYAGAAVAQDIPWADSAEEVGMSTERLARINAAMQRHVEAGTIQGAVTAVARRGKLVHLEAHGLMSVPDNRPMQDDSLFIMMSSTKPVLGVAAMMLIEEGLVRPSDPISKWFPTFAEMQVAVLAEPADEDVSPVRVSPFNVPAHRLVPAAREITAVSYTHLTLPTNLRV